MTTQLIDASSLPSAVRHPRIFDAFDALAVGESFVLSNDHYPLPLLYQFQAERPNQFDWSVLEVGPRFRVEIRKRDARVPRSVDEYLTWDHCRLDALLDETIDLFEQSSLEEARKRYGEFACGLDRHISMEETILFPVFEARVPEASPIRVMRFEHEQIREAMRAIAASLGRGDERAFHAGIETLVSVLGEHNAKEEQVLYPLIDRMSTGDESGDLVRRMQTAR